MQKDQEYLSGNVIKRYWVVIVLLLFSLAAVLNSGRGGLIILSDTFFPFHPVQDFFRITYSWFTYYLGFENIGALPTITLRLFPLIFDSLGIPLWITNRLWFVVPLLLLGVSMYYLSGCFFKNNFARFLASLFYVCNPLVTEQIIGSSPPIIISNAMRAFTIAFLVKGLREKESKYILYAAIAFVFGLADLHGAVLTVVLSLICLLFFGLIDKRGVGLNNLFVFTSKAFILCLLICSYVLLPSIYQFTSTDVYKANLGDAPASDVLEYTEPYTSIMNVGRLIYGSPTPYGPHNFHLYNETMFGPLSMFIIVMLAYSVLFYKRVSKTEMFFVLLALIFTMLSTGINKPFGFLFELLWDNFKWFRVFRNPMKFTYFTALSYSVLIGFAYIRLRERFHNRGGHIISALVVVFILASGWPILTGNALGKLVAVNVPQYYNEARDWLMSHDEDFRVFTVPFNDWYVRYDWTPYDQQNIVLPYLGVPVVAGDAGRTMTEDTIDGLAYLTLHSQNSLNGLDKLLALMNTRYVMLQNDLYDNDDIERRLKKKLDNYHGLKKIKNFGKLDFYETGPYALPHIYPASSLTLVEGGLSALMKMPPGFHLDPRPAYVFTGRQSDEYKSLINRRLKFDNRLVVNSPQSSLAGDKPGQTSTERPGEDRSYLFYPTPSPDNSSGHEKYAGDGSEIGRRKFYVGREKEYMVRAGITPRRVFVPDERADPVPNFVSLVKDGGQYLDDWQVRGRSASLKKNSDRNELVVTSMFDRSSGKDIILSRSFPHIDLQKTPYAAMTFKMDDPNVQKAMLGLWIASGMTDLYLPRKIFIEVDVPRITSKYNGTFLVNLYEAAQAALPGREKYELVKLEIFLGKGKEPGSTDESRSREFNFVVADIRLLKERPVVIKNKIAGFGSDFGRRESFYYIDHDQRPRRAEDFAGVPSGIEAVFKPAGERFLDLETVPDIELTLPASQGSVQVLLGLDFDGDNRVDGEAGALLDVEGDKLSIPAFKIASDAHPKKRMYHLLNIGFSSDNNKYRIETFRQYKQYFYTPKEFITGSPCLEVDGKVYNLPGDFKRYEKDGSFWLEFGPISLKKGYHSLSVTKGREFKTDTVEIAPLAHDKPLAEGSDMEFESINSTRYIVYAKGIKTPFTLVFSEKFHTGWKAYIRKPSAESVGDGREIKEHFLVNGYANGWVVPAENTGDFEIVLEYKPQSLFELGLLISLATVLGAVAYLGYGRWRERT